jgi:hypothetical protein
MRQSTFPRILFGFLPLLRPTVVIFFFAHAQNMTFYRLFSKYFWTKAHPYTGKPFTVDEPQPFKMGRLFWLPFSAISALLLVDVAI